MAEGPPKKKRRVAKGQMGRRLEVIAPQPSLGFLPDNILLKIMSLLDIPSLLHLSHVNKRYHLLYTDEYLWRDVDLSTVPRLDVHKVKKVIRDRLHPTLWRITLKSNAVECQRKPTLRPIITTSALDELFKKCPLIQDIRLHNCDLGQFPDSCLLWRSSTIQRVTFTNCIAPFKWLQTVKPHWPNLSHFSVPSTNKTSDCDLVYIASRKEGWSETLRHVNVSNCYRLKREGIQSLCKTYPDLHSLDISLCKNLTKDCLDLVVEHMKHMQYLNIAGCFETAGVVESIRQLPATCAHLQLLVVSPRQLLLDNNCSLRLRSKTTNVIIQDQNAEGK